MKGSSAASRIGGAIRAPASKSSMQRAVACALLADGTSTLRNPSFSADCLAALRVAEGLGAEVERGEGAVAVKGAARRGAGARVPAAASATGSGVEVAARRLSCGESGLCIRMFAPVAALFPGETILEAEGSLRKRPLSMLDGALDGLGARCATQNGFPPVLVRGPLRGGPGRVDGSESSQLVTGLLIALAAAELDSRLEVDGLVSGGYVDLTIDTMRAFGAVARRTGQGTFELEGRQAYRPADFEVEGDWSGAAFLLVAGALAATGAPLVVSGLRLDSSQPDRAVLGALEAAGAGLESRPDGIAVARRGLRAFSFDASDCPDLFPPLVALAAACGGLTELRGARRLRHKESDRAAALSALCASLGAEAMVEGDLMRIRGAPRLGGGRVDSRGDHRIAMAAAVASLVAEGSVEIEGAECVSKSWPTFFEDLGRLGTSA